MQRQQIPGVSLAIVKNGRPLLVKGYGFSNLEHRVPVKAETVFQSGSVGKQFTASAIMMLVEDGKIGLEDNIGKYLGDVPDAWKSITIRHLLTHTGGMTDYPDDFDFRRDLTEDELLKKAKEIPLAFAPGEKWQYSNLGFVTLGIIISKVTRKFYGDFLQERIFKPLGMTSARIISEADIVPNRAAGYRLVEGKIKNQNWVAPSMNTTADGSLYLTALDMIKWDEGLRHGRTLAALPRRSRTPGCKFAATHSQMPSHFVVFGVPSRFWPAIHGKFRFLTCRNGRAGIPPCRDCPGTPRAATPLMCGP